MVCVRGEKDEEDDGGPGGVKASSGVRERERKRESFLESCGAEDSEIEGVYRVMYEIYNLYIFIFLLTCCV